MRLRLPTATSVLARLADGVETTGAVLDALRTLLDELAEIAAARARHEHYERPADRIQERLDALTGRIEDATTAEAILARAVGGPVGPPSPRRGHLSLVREQVGGETA